LGPKTRKRAGVARVVAARFVNRRCGGEEGIAADLGVNDIEAAGGGARSNTEASRGRLSKNKTRAAGVGMDQNASRGAYAVN